MAAGGEQQQIGKGEPAVEARDQRVAFEMVDREERLAARRSRRPCRRPARPARRRSAPDPPPRRRRRGLARQRRPFPARARSARRAPRHGRGRRSPARRRHRRHARRSGSSPRRRGFRRCRRAAAARPPPRSRRRSSQVPEPASAVHDSLEIVALSIRLARVATGFNAVADAAPPRSSPCFARATTPLATAAALAARGVDRGVRAGRGIRRDRRRRRRRGRSISSSPPAPRRSTFAAPQSLAAAAARAALRRRRKDRRRRARAPASDRAARRPPPTSPRCCRRCRLAARSISPGATASPISRPRSAARVAALVVYEARARDGWDDGEVAGGRRGEGGAALFRAQRGSGGRISPKRPGWPRRSDGCRMSRCRAASRPRSPPSASRGRCGRASRARRRCWRRWNRRWPISRGL